MMGIPNIAHSRLLLAIVVLSVHRLCLAVSSRRSVRGWIWLVRLALAAKSEERQLRESELRERHPERAYTTHSPKATPHC